MGKPNTAKIREAVPLSKLPTRGDDPIMVCSVCGQPSPGSERPLTLWREHDEADRPIAGYDALVFLGRGDAHASCRKELDKHPRLYDEVTGDPGHFPRLCGPCVRREGFACRHPDLRANGGPGLGITLTRLPAIICSRGRGCSSPVRDAVACKGRRTLALLPASNTEGNER